MDKLHPDIESQIEKHKEISPDIKMKLDTAIAAFKKEFKAKMGAA
jgi:hypothetical protein